MSSTTPKLEHRERVTLRWRDMDMLGHLNQSVYHELLEEGRAALIYEILRRSGDGRDRPGGFVLARVELDHLAEVRKDHGQVEVVARVVGVGNSSLQVEHEIIRSDGVVAASGRTVMVAWDPVARGKRPLTEAERAALA